MNETNEARKTVMVKGVITLIDLFFMVLDKIRYFSENTFCYNCIQEG